MQRWPCSQASNESEESKLWLTRSTARTVRPRVLPLSCLELSCEGFAGLRARPPTRFSVRMENFTDRVLFLVSKAAIQCRPRPSSVPMSGSVATIRNSWHCCERHGKYPLDIPQRRLKSGSSSRRSKMSTLIRTYCALVTMWRWLRAATISMSNGCQAGLFIGCHFTPGRPERASLCSATVTSMT